jgi:O-antigen ligase
MINNKRIYNIVTSLVIAMLPAGYVLKGGIQGNLLTDKTLYIYYVAFLITSITILVYKKVSLNKFDLYLLLFVIWVISGVFYTPDIYGGIYKILKLILLSISVIYIERILIREQIQFDYIYNFYNIFSVVISIAFILTYYFSNKVGRASFLDTTPVAFGYFLGFDIIILLQLISQRRKNIVKYWYGISLIFVFYALLLNATKGVFISILVTLILFFPKYKMEYNIKEVLLLLIIMLFAFISVSNNLEKIPVLQRFVYITKDLSTIERINLYKDAINEFISHPFTGIGTNGLYVYPHNIFLEIGAENGIIGLVLFLLLVFYVIKLIKKYNYNNTLIKQLMIYSLIGNMFSFSYVINKYLYFSLGLFFADLYLKNKIPEKFHTVK